MELRIERLSIGTRGSQGVRLMLSNPTVYLSYEHSYYGAQSGINNLWKIYKRHFLPSPADFVQNQAHRRWRKFERVAGLVILSM